MAGLLDDLASPAGAAGIAAALLWLPLTGFPTWPALARGRLASTVAVSVAVGGVAFILVQRLTAPAVA